jgi:hypothetical protein
MLCVFHSYVRIIILDKESLVFLILHVFMLRSSVAQRRVSLLLSSRRAVEIKSLNEDTIFMFRWPNLHM